MKETADWLREILLTNKYFIASFSLTQNTGIESIDQNVFHSMTLFRKQ